MVFVIDGGDCDFSGEAAVALRLGPCALDRPPAFFAETVEYHRRKSLHHKVGLARVQGRVVSAYGRGRLERVGAGRGMQPVRRADVPR